MNACCKSFRIKHFIKNLDCIAIQYCDATELLNHPKDLKMIKVFRNINVITDNVNVNKFIL